MNNGLLICDGAGNKTDKVASFLTISHASQVCLFDLLFNTNVAPTLFCCYLLSPFPAAISVLKFRSFAMFFCHVLSSDAIECRHVLLLFLTQLLKSL